MDMFDGHLVLFLNKKSLSIVCSIDLPMAIGRKVLISLLSYILFMVKHSKSLIPVIYIIEYCTQMQSFSSTHRAFISLDI